MSATEVTMYRIVCDWPGCGANAHEGGDYYAYSDESEAREEAAGADWRQGCDGRDYCAEHPVEWSGDHEDGEPWPEPPYLRMHDGDDAYPDCDDGSVHLITTDGAS